jgi:hypothetical protein
MWSSQSILMSIFRSIADFEQTIAAFSFASAVPVNEIFDTAANTTTKNNKTNDILFIFVSFDVTRYYDMVRTGPAILKVSARLLSSRV